MRCIATTSDRRSATVEHFESLTNLFLDGVTSDDDDAQLFSHLSQCTSCRCRLNTLVEFRRMVQDERFEVPSWTDSELFRRIERKSIRSDLMRRSARAYKPPYTVRVRTMAGPLAMIVALLLAVVALLTKTDAPSSTAIASHEVVFFEPVPFSMQPVYVFYPGLVIEESR